MQRLFKIKNITDIINFIKHNAQCINSSFFFIINNPLRYIFFIIPLSICFFLVLVSYNSQKIIENNFNSDLKKQLKDVTSEVIKVAGDKNLSDDLTLVGLGN